MSEGETPSERGVNRGSGYLANVGTSFKTDGKEFPSVLCVCVLQVILANESIVLCMCSGNIPIG